jgi:hypothetical protein
MLLFLVASGLSLRGNGIPQLHPLMALWRVL